MKTPDPVFVVDPRQADRNTGLIVRAFDPARGEHRLADVMELDDHSLVSWINWTGAGVHLVGLLLGRGIIWSPADNAEVTRKVARLGRMLSDEFTPTNGRAK